MRSAFEILNRMKDDGVIRKFAVGRAVATSIHLEPTTTADTSPLVSEAVDNAQEFEADGLAVSVFSPEYLAAIALETGRPKDKLRLDTLVKSGILDKRKLNAILRRHGLERKFGEWLKWQRTL